MGCTRPISFGDSNELLYIYPKQCHDTARFNKRKEVI